MRVGSARVQEVLGKENQMDSGIGHEHEGVMGKDRDDAQISVWVMYVCRKELTQGMRQHHP